MPTGRIIRLGFIGFDHPESLWRTSVNLQWAGCRVEEAVNVGLGEFAPAIGFEPTNAQGCGGFRQVGQSQVAGFTNGKGLCGHG